MFLHQDRIFIVAGGPSAKGIDFERFKHKGYLLGVNESGIILPVDGVLTMDRLWWENRWKQCLEKKIDCFVRHTVYDGFIGKFHPGWGNLYRVEMHYDKTELSTVPYIVHGNNSGFCAFNFATLFKPREIFLFGFDFQGTKKDVHWYKQYTWSDKTTGNHYRKFAPPFTDAYNVCLKNLNIKVYNCSNISLIKGIPTVTEEEVLKICHVV